MVPGNTEGEHLTHYPEIQGLNPATDTGQSENEKIYEIQFCLTELDNNSFQQEDLRSNNEHY